MPYRRNETNEAMQYDGDFGSDCGFPGGPATPNDVETNIMCLLMRAFTALGKLIEEKVHGHDDNLLKLISVTECLF